MKRILVKKGIEFISIKTEDIAYFYTQHKIVFLVDNSGNRFIIDKSLSILEEELNKETFFRVNRKYLVNINAIGKFKPLTKGRILLEIKHAPQEEIAVSQENAPSFRKWIDR